MIDKKHTQKRISNVIQAYKIGFPKEYKLACEGVLETRRRLKDEMGKLNVELSGVAPQRALHEIPEKLYTALVKTLDQEELLYWKSKECSRWFIKNNPEFSLTQ